MHALLKLLVTLEGLDLTCDSDLMATMGLAFGTVRSEQDYLLLEGMFCLHCKVHLMLWRTLFLNCVHLNLKQLKLKAHSCGVLNQCSMADLPLELQGTVCCARHVLRAGMFTDVCCWNMCLFSGAIDSSDLAKLVQSAVRVSLLFIKESYLCMCVAVISVRML